jgi:hypothetical protein
MAKELFVSNLHESIDEGTLHQHFKVYGNIINIHLITDDDGSFKE